MTPGRLALDLWMGGAVLSLISIVLLIVAWAVTSLLTVAQAWRRARRPHDLGELSRWYPVTELSEIDEALDRIMDEEHAQASPRTE